MRAVLSCPLAYVSHLTARNAKHFINVVILVALLHLEYQVAVPQTYSDFPSEERLDGVGVKGQLYIGSSLAIYYREKRGKKARGPDKNGVSNFNVFPVDYW